MVDPEFHKVGEVFPREELESIRFVIDDGNEQIGIQAHDLVTDPKQPETLIGTALIEDPETGFVDEKRIRLSKKSKIREAAVITAEFFEEHRDAVAAVSFVVGVVALKSLSVRHKNRQ